MAANKMVECGDCDGDGRFHYGKHWYECAECDGSGKVKNKDVVARELTVDCEICKGTGHSFSTKQIPDGRHVQVRYLQKILALPNVEYLPDTSGEVYTKPAVLFRFTGGVGLVMPVMM